MSARPGPPIVILGGGLAGISAARTLRSGYELYEAADRLGGLARTETIRGHRFDQTGHWLHLRDRSVRQAVRRAMGDALAPHDRTARIFSHGALTRYPFQANLHGLPPGVAYECLKGFLDRRDRTERPRDRRTFEGFIQAHFGEGIARHFMVPYNQKLWGVHPREMTDAWCQRYVPTPDRDAVLRGAVGYAPPEMGYNVGFLYPRAGGIEPLALALSRGLSAPRVHRGASVEQIDLRRRQVQVGGEWRPYRALVSSIPLPRLCEQLVAPPKRVLEAAERLRWTSLQYLNVGLRRPPPTDYHWVYLPEPELPAYRVGVFTRAAPAMAPRGRASLYVELAARSHLRETEAARRVAPMLVACGAMAARRDLAFAALRRIEFAYVIFDAHHARATATLHRYFRERGVFLCGRYGLWTYGSMEDAIVQGRQAAREACRVVATRR